MHQQRRRRERLSVTHAPRRKDKSEVGHFQCFDPRLRYMRLNVCGRGAKLWGGDERQRDAWCHERSPPLLLTLLLLRRRVQVVFLCVWMALTGWLVVRVGGMKCRGSRGDPVRGVSCVCLLRCSELYVWGGLFCWHWHSTKIGRRKVRSKNGALVHG